MSRPQTNFAAPLPWDDMLCFFLCFVCMRICTTKSPPVGGDSASAFVFAFVFLRSATVSPPWLPVILRVRKFSLLKGFLAHSGSLVANFFVVGLVEKKARFPIRHQISHSHAV